MISSLLDNDLYKLTMMQAVWERYPDATVTYEFINRRPSDKFNHEFCDRLSDELLVFRDLRLSPDERNWLETQGLFKTGFLEFLASFLLLPSQVSLELVDGSRLRIEIAGRWLETILWEVPLMALISEVYFETVERAWDKSFDLYLEKTLTKGTRLAEAGCRFTDFGTRRRRSSALHRAVVEAFTSLEGERRGFFLGTSNMHLAREFGIPPIGTMAHEWIMAHAGLFGVSGANRKALHVWREIYGDRLLIALTDTYTTDLFLKEFSGPLAQQYEGVRHDSESPFPFAEKVIGFYHDEGIDPSTRKAVFSDSLDVDRAIAIQERVGGEIQPLFGIGTHFTNDFPGSPALNMVIKMSSINGRPVAKISDDPSKASGPKSAIHESLTAIERAMEDRKTR